MNGYQHHISPIWSIQIRTDLNSKRIRTQIQTENIRLFAPLPFSAKANWERLHA
jgi:hypothetical protein